MDKEVENHEYIGKYVSEIYRDGNKFFSKAYAKYNIGAGQYLFLRVLYKEERPTQEYLSNILNIDKATTARALKKLEDEGYIYREKSEDDKRANVIELTQKALNIKEEFFEVHRLWEKKITEYLDDSEKALALKLLKKIATNNILRKE
ncbi:MarR family winged helix-turn-helix transcriptional regulator [Clostridium paraputrificum]|uniref:MarR family winged helix-turn-helix transcriptional regulator n=1 Tax=Clostridium TaxID=1485 RepID=UPI003D33AB24